jgi:hypothetical protein
LPLCVRRSRITVRLKPDTTYVSVGEPRGKSGEVDE